MADYSSFTNSIRIPFVNDETSVTTPAIDVTVNGKKIEGVGLDSGSTAFALHVDLVPGFPDTAEGRKTLQKGSIVYSTAGRHWDGYWFPVTVELDDGIENTTNIITSKVHALVITDQYRVKDEKTGEKTPEFDTGIHYMGIAFPAYNDKKPNDPVDKNPLLAITEYKGQLIDKTNFRLGYIINDRSLDVGLTATNTQDFKSTKLTPSSDHPWCWKDVSSAISLNGGPWMPGTTLIDTGVSHMAIYSPKYDKNLDPKSAPLKVAMRFPGEKTDLPEFAFDWPVTEGNEEPWLPTSISYYQSINETSWVNTGQNFIEKFSCLFDAEEGYWGIKEAAA
jgi:hypothetical protein